MKIIGLGDSIMAYNDATTFPQTGWCQVLPLFIKKDFDIKVIDKAMNGRSTKSFIDEGLFDEAINLVEKDDLVIISFGHNDEKKDEERHTDPYEGYDKNLTMMINEVKKRGATPVLVTSWPRLVKDEEGKIYSNHGEYPKAMKNVAKREGVYLVDLLTEGLELLNNLGYEKAKNLYMILEKDLYPNYPEGKEDTSHLRPLGAMSIASIFVKHIKEYKDFSKYFN